MLCFNVGPMHFLCRDLSYIKITSVTLNKNTFLYLIQTNASILPNITFIKLETPTGANATEYTCLWTSTAQVIKKQHDDKCW